MSDKTLLVFFSIVIVVIFSTYFNRKYTERLYDKFKDKPYTWYWFRIFKIPETKDNYTFFLRSLAVFVISVIVLAGVWIIVRPL